jgi:hypothetical protein
MQEACQIEIARKRATATDRVAVTCPNFEHLNRECLNFSHFHALK